MSGLPDGASASDYAYLRAVDRAGLMWEWLRRDADYIGWYVRASAATGGDLRSALRWRLLFAEDPSVTALHARLLWRADLDPGALRVIARRAAMRDPLSLPLHRLRQWMSIVRTSDDREWVVISDGLNHIRLDVDEGTLADGPVLVHFLLGTVDESAPKLVTARRLTALCRDRKFSADLFPRDPRRERDLTLLRAFDAVRCGASQRDVAEFLFGIQRTARDWRGPSDFLRSRVRRLITQANRLAAGGYRWLMRNTD